MITCHKIQSLQEQNMKDICQTCPNLNVYYLKKVNRLAIFCKKASKHYTTLHLYISLNHLDDNWSGVRVCVACCILYILSHINCVSYLIVYQLVYFVTCINCSKFCQIDRLLELLKDCSRDVKFHGSSLTSKTNFVIRILL